MGSDDHDWSYFKIRTSRPSRRALPDAPPKRDGVARTKYKCPAPRVQRMRPGAIFVPAEQTKMAIKRLLAFEPHLSVDQIFERLRFSIIVSRTTVSGIRTEFRHSLKVIADAGLLRR